ncbi:hypothetical protein GCM10027282_04960 [Frigoribacterium salinisoli]
MRRPEGFDEPGPPRRKDGSPDRSPSRARRDDAPGAPGAATGGPAADDVATGPVPTDHGRTSGADRARSLASGAAGRLGALGESWRRGRGSRDGAADVPAGARPSTGQGTGAPAGTDQGDGAGGTGPAAAERPVPVLGPAPSTAADASARARGARRAARRASAERRRTERAEVRRFTRRSRHRRAASLTAAGLVVVLVASVLVAVFSPLLALRTVTVEGAERVDPAAVQAALGDQMGTPLALLDFDEVERSLEAFPLIASYVTETAPPDTLVVRISERQPVATVAVGDGFDLVDPAGVVVQRLGARPEGVPLVDVGAAEVDGPLFRAVGEVLLGLPVQLRATVDTATASTPDDVTLTLTTGERVVWGSADESARKAQVLAGLVADQARRDPGADVEYDVSAPDAGIIRGK